jgi:multiple sugar transport system substrate-binding protein
MMGFSKEETTSIFSLTAYPFFCSTVAKDAEAVKKLNALDPSAGEYMRPTLEKMEQFLNDGCVDLDACAEIEDNYDAVILRFFEGDVPMMLATGNTVSGTEKREAKSEAFTQHPFRYSFHPVPSTEQGGYFVNTVSIGFAVNRNSANLDLANEFMRFLVSTNELNLMAKAKRMVTPCVDMSLDRVYAPFEKLDSSRMINLSELGLSDDAASQVSRAGWQVSNGLMSVDEAVAAFGAIE